jgi:hypothetical protein
MLTSSFGVNLLCGLSAYIQSEMLASISLTQLTLKNNMKTKLLSLFTAFGLITNAAIASSASIGYTSDFFYRGEQKALESFQSKVDYGVSILGLDTAWHACTNQSVDQGVDSYGLSFAAGKSFSDGLLSAYVGFNHFEDVPGEALSEVFVQAGSNIVLNPSVSVYRNVDEELFTYEGSISHSLDLKVASLNLDASAGNTEVSTSDNRTYYSVGAELARQIGAGVDAGVSVDLVDSDDIEREFVFGAALTFNF